MAKKIESIYLNWQEVDEAMRQLGELQIKKAHLEGEQTKKINEIKAETALKSNYIDVQIKEIEKNIERFADVHKEEFAKERSKKLNFGLIGFRTTEKVCCTAVKEAIKVLKVLNLNNCIRNKEELDKKEILKCDETLLLKAGIKINRADKIRIEPTIEKIAEVEGKKND